MKDERQNENLEEVVKNAFAGYGVVVLGVVCFVIVLIIVTALVRLIVGAGAGTVG